MTDTEVLDRVTRDIASGVEPIDAAAKWVNYQARSVDAPQLARAAIEAYRASMLAPAAIEAPLP